MFFATFLRRELHGSRGNLSRALRLTFVLVTHDSALARRAQHVAVMKSGRPLHHKGSEAAGESRSGRRFAAGRGTGGRT